jgi:putative tryptophan/tyrosine transport system substrate-binding protein
VVFAQVTDPVALGLVESLSRPGGNITGFAVFEYAIALKWLELLKQIAPHVTRIAIPYDPELPSSPAYIRTIEATAPSFRVEILPHPVRDAGAMARAIEIFVAEPNGGLILLPSALALHHRDFGRVKAGASRPRAARGYGRLGQIDQRGSYRAVATLCRTLRRGRSHPTRDQSTLLVDPHVPVDHMLGH